MNARLAIGLIFVMMFTAAAVLAPQLAPEAPGQMSLKDRLETPSLAHPLGRDDNGGDIVTGLLYGARISLTVACVVVGTGALLGLLLGSLAGFSDGPLSLGLMRFVDIVSAFPGFLLALSLVAMLGPALRHLILALALTAWAPFARLVRAEVMHLKSREYVLCARAVGASNRRLLIVHIWPNLLSLMVVQMTFALSGVVLAESGLSFLGLGVSPSTPTWGALLNAGRRVLNEAPHVSLAPGLAILLLVLGFNLLGEGLRQRLDPRRGANKV